MRVNDKKYFFETRITSFHSRTISQFDHQGKNNQKQFLPDANGFPTIIQPFHYS
jgi:hypothetical protein